MSKEKRMERPPNHYDLNELKDWLRVRLEDGIDCPCCGQRAQVYKRRVSRAMVTTMGNMYDAQLSLDHEAHVEKDGQFWVHLADIEQKSRDTATCAYFGLIREHTHERGLWKVTEEGVSFMQGGHRIFKYAHVFDGKVVGYSGKQLTVFEVAPHFDLSELLYGSKEG